MLKMISLVVVLVSGVCVFLAKKILSAILKREPSEMEVVILKSVGMLIVLAGACTMILPDLL